MIEKPIGHDLASFNALDASISQHFHEQQVFRMDHFLGEETVQNILALRFANPIFEPIWNRSAPGAYETLLRDLWVGDATHFMRTDQVRAAWELLQPIITTWDEIPATDFPNYAAGSWGPEAAERLIAAGGDAWLVPTL